MKRYSSTTRGSSRRTLHTKALLRIIAGLTLVIILGLVLPRVFTFTGNVILYPYHLMRVWVLESNDSLPVYLRDRAAIVEDIRELESDLATAQSSQGSIKRLVTENMALRALLGATSTARISARVIARPNELPYDLIMIDQGSRDGVVENAPVFIGQDQVIGYISHTARTHSFVELVTAPGFSSTVYIIGPNIYTNAEGLGGGIMRVRVPQGLLLTKGDLVLLPAVDSGIYGQVVRVESEPTQPQQYGYLTPQVSMQSLRYVAVGREPIEALDFEEVDRAVAKRVTDIFTVNVPQDALVTVSTSTATTSEQSRATSTPSQ